MSGVINTDGLQQSMDHVKKYIDTTVENKITGSGEFMVTGLVKDIPGIGSNNDNPIDHVVEFGRTFDTIPVVVPSIIGPQAVYNTTGWQLSPISIIEITNTQFTRRSYNVLPINISWVALGK